MGDTPMLKFVSVERDMPEKRDASVRKEDFREIYAEYADAKAKEQAGRCSQCGVPYCQSHCPLHNNIPGNLRTHLPAGSPVRRQLRDRAIRTWHRYDRFGREIHH